MKCHVCGISFWIWFGEIIKQCRCFSIPDAELEALADTPDRHFEWQE